MLATCLQSPLFDAAGCLLTRVQILLADRSTVVIFAQIIANLPFNLLQLLNSADLLSQRPRLQLVCDGPGQVVGNESLYGIPLVFMMR